MQTRIWSLFAALLLTANAHAVIVDFDSNYSATPTNYTYPPNSVFGVSSQGFAFGLKEPRGPSYDGVFVLQSSASSSGNYMTGASPVGGFPIDIWREDGQLFSLTSLDLGGVYPVGLCSTPPCEYTDQELEIHGYDAAGTLTHTFKPPPSGSLYRDYSSYWQTIVFDSSWTNLAYVTIETQAIYRSDPLSLGDAYNSAPGLDNVNLSVVPLPAAGWLFGTALGLLGWRSGRRDRPGSC